MAKTAVVLAGGGSRGAYQIGAWRALRELNIPIDMVTGTSVGALNGALMVQGEFEAAEKLWANISPEDVMNDILGDADVSPHDSPAVWKAFIRDVLEQGGVDITPLEKMIRSILDEKRFRASPVEYALVTVELPSLKPHELTKEQIPEGMLCDYLLASSACFPAFKARQIDGTFYVDGGYWDNMPIRLAQEMGADTIYAVDLESVGMVRRLRKKPQKLTLIRSSWDLGPFIYFDSRFARRNMKLGYLDTMKACGKYEGWQYTFRPKDWSETMNRLAPVCEKAMEVGRANNPPFVRALESFMTRRFIRDFSHKARPDQNMSLRQALTLAAEYCGEIFEIDPTQVQDFEAFNSRMLHSLSHVDFVPTQCDPAEAAAKILDELKEKDRRFITGYLMEQLQEFLVPSGHPFNLLLFAAPYWKELAAAWYLLILSLAGDFSTIHLS